MVCAPTSSTREQIKLSCGVFMCTRFVSGGCRYMLGMLSSVLEEVETAFDGYQFYKASQVT